MFLKSYLLLSADELFQPDHVRKVVLLAGSGVFAQDNLDGRLARERVRKAVALEAKIIPGGRLHIDLFERGDLQVAGGKATGDVVAAAGIENARGGLFHFGVVGLPGYAVIRSQVSRANPQDIETHLGDFFGIAPTGKKVILRGVHIMRIADGKVAEHWGSNDDLGLMQQLGMALQPAEPA